MHRSRCATLSHASPARLLLPRAQARAGVRVERVERSAQGVTLTPAAGPPARFDELVFACGAEEALRMLGPSADW